MFRKEISNNKKDETKEVDAKKKEKYDSIKESVQSESLNIVRRPEFPAFSIKHSVLKNLEEDDENDEIDPSLPKDEYTAEQFQLFWEAFLSDLRDVNKPAYNVLQTAKWRITVDYDIELTFDSSVMVLEFDKLRENFLMKIREKLNNYHIQVKTKISKNEVLESHIKTRKEKFLEMTESYPALEKLRIALGLDIENEP